MAPHLSYLRDKEKKAKKICAICEICGTKIKQREKRICGKNEKSPDYFRNRGFVKEGGYLLSRIALQYHRRK